MNKYKFQVPGLGVVELEAKDDNDAYTEICDKLGIKLIYAFEKGVQPVAKPQLRLVQSDKSQVTVNA